MIDYFCSNIAYSYNYHYHYLLKKMYAYPVIINEESVNHLIKVITCNIKYFPFHIHKFIFFIMDKHINVKMLITYILGVKLLNLYDLAHYMKRGSNLPKSQNEQNMENNSNV